MLLTLMHKQPTIIAHRGNSAQAPENTRAAFKLAIRTRVDFLECDVQITKDKIPILMHDATFCRIVNSPDVLHVGDLTLEEIRQFDIGSWFDPKFADQRVMTLEEFLLMPKENIGVMVEIKQETFCEYEVGKALAKVLARVEPHIHGHGPILIGSLNPNILLCLKGCLPMQRFIPILEKMEDLNDFLSLNVRHFAINHLLVTRELINHLHLLGAAVWTWTVDDKNEAKNLLDLGVDGLITNHPKKMMAFHELMQTYG